MKYIFEGNYLKRCKLKIKVFATGGGVIDWAAFLLSNFNNNNRQILQQLLLPF
jgi:hypothetical protein